MAMRGTRKKTADKPPYHHGDLRRALLHSRADGLLCPEELAKLGLCFDETPGPKRRSVVINDQVEMLCGFLQFKPST